MPDKPDELNSELVCNLYALNDAERAKHLENGDVLFASVTQTQELADGYAFGFTTGTEIIRRAADFITYERLCCPFFRFGLEFEPDHGAMWLKLTGSPEIKAFVAQNFAEIFNKS